MEENKFPIYSFVLSWNQKDFQKNGTSFRIMFKEEPTEDILEGVINKHKKQIDEKYGEVEWLKTEYKFVEHESWCINWFNHYTYNIFEDDSDVEKSFSEFLERKKKFNIQNEHFPTEYRFENDKPFYSLMGAEDRWRWNICRCEHCKEQGKITIDH